MSSFPDLRLRSLSQGVMFYILLSEKDVVSQRRSQRICFMFMVELERDEHFKLPRVKVE
jgi:hypothetical protein